MNMIIPFIAYHALGGSMVTGLGFHDPNPRPRKTKSQRQKRKASRRMRKQNKRR